MTHATYDERCWDLAVVFLAAEPEKDTPENRHALATAIQRTIEDEIAFHLASNVKIGRGQ